MNRSNFIQALGRDIVEKYDGVGSIWLVNKLYAVIADPESLEVVMKTCLEKDDMMNVAKGLIGHSSILAPVPIWRPRRKMLVSTFGQKSLNSFVKTFTIQSGIMMNKLKHEAGNGKFSMSEYIAKFSMDTLCENVLGTKIHAQSISSHPFPLAFHEFCMVITARLLKPWLYSDALYKWTNDYPICEKNIKTLKEYVDKIINAKRNEMMLQKNNSMTQGDSKSKCLLEHMIESGLSDLEVKEESLVMLVAGIDTTTVSSSFLCLMLAKHPEIQDKVYQEIIEVIGDTERQIEPNDLPKMKYLDAVIKETLRMYPPGPIIVRRVDKNVTLPSGVTLVPGMGVFLHIWATHRNQKYWGPDVDVFRPERFLEGPLKHPYAFLAFSNGPKGCIGYQYSMMSIKTLMAHLLRRYRILPSSPESVNTNDYLPTTFTITLKHVDNFEIKIELRNN